MRPKIFLSYINTPTFSGQSASSVLLIDLLSKNGWSCEKIPLFPFIRGKSSRFFAIVNFIKNQFITLQSVIALITTRDAFLYINLGQSIPSFIRVSIWYIPYKLLKPRSKVIISLHGSLFMAWSSANLKRRIFLRLLRKANAVTVVGNNQKATLIKLGLLQSKIYVVPNTFDLTSNLEPAFDLKFAANKSVKLLHLSLLIESKGFPEYLEALKLISNTRKDILIDAVLCGPVSFTGYCTRFKNATQKSEWIVNEISAINQSANVTVKWIKGASGFEKQQLFQDAEIFVFPSQFPVEAQPLVLLEAMASGCAIITSNVGEIGSTIDKECAIILEEITVDKIAASIIKLCSSYDHRKKLGQNGFERVKSHFSTDVYLSNWLNILQTI